MQVAWEQSYWAWKCRIEEMCDGAEWNTSTSKRTLLLWFFSAGVEIAKSQGAKYRLGPELEIRYNGLLHLYPVVSLWRVTLSKNSVISAAQVNVRPFTCSYLFEFFLYSWYILHTLHTYSLFLQWLWMCGPLLWVGHIAPQLSSPKEATWISCHWRHHLWRRNVGFPTISYVFFSTPANIPSF